MVELYVLSGVAGCFWSNAIKYGRIPIDVFPLLNFPQVSTSDVEVTTLRSFLHSVCIGPFLLGEGLAGCGKGQPLR